MENQGVESLIFYTDLTLDDVAGQLSEQTGLASDQVLEIIKRAIPEIENYNGNIRFIEGPRGPGNPEMIYLCMVGRNKPGHRGFSAIITHWNKDLKIVLENSSAMVA